jgi:hypothetical protein
LHQAEVAATRDSSRLGSILFAGRGSLTIREIDFTGEDGLAEFLKMHIFIFLFQSARRNFQMKILG